MAVYKETLQKPGFTACSTRWILSYVGFLCFACVYATRINMSMAIICMVVKGNVSDPDFSNTSQSTPDDASCGELESNQASYEGEFYWSKSTQGHILSSFFYGYIVTQIPAGLLASRYGGKHVLGTGMLLTGIATVLMPVAARIHVFLLVALRVVAGIGTGVSFPAMHAMMGKWAPPLERSKLATFCYAGTTLGNILTLSLSGLMCGSGIDNGWPLILYSTGGVTILWYILWMFTGYSSPAQHPRISKAEQKYILTSIGKTVTASNIDRTPVPWLELLKSKPLWSIIVAHMCNNWGGYTLLTSLPTYMKEVLQYDFKQNGFLSSLPYVVQFLACTLGGQAADYIRYKTSLSTTAVRKIFQITGFMGQAVFIVAAGFVQCEVRYLSVVFLAISVGFTFGSRAGYGVNHIDIAPRFAGLLFGITNTFATIPGILAPNVASALTPNGTREEWLRVWLLCAGFFAFGATIFGIFSSGEVQEWAVKSMENDSEDEENEKPLKEMTLNNEPL